jgi:hypothetical protein
MENDPFQVGELVGAATSAVKVDGNLDPVKAAAALRQAAQVGLNTYTLPVDGVTHGDQQALELIDDEARPILDFFRGTAGPPPTTPPTTGG